MQGSDRLSLAAWRPDELDLGWVGQSEVFPGAVGSVESLAADQGGGPDWVTAADGEGGTWAPTKDGGADDTDGAVGEAETEMEGPCWTLTVVETAGCDGEEAAIGLPAAVIRYTAPPGSVSKEMRHEASLGCRGQYDTVIGAASPTPSSRVSGHTAKLAVVSSSSARSDTGRRPELRTGMAWVVGCPSGLASCRCCMAEGTCRRGRAAIAVSLREARTGACGLSVAMDRMALCWVCWRQWRAYPG